MALLTPWEFSPTDSSKRAIESGVVSSSDGSEFRAENVQPASLDLRLGEVAYRIRCSFLPDHADGRAQDDKDYVIDELDLHKDGAVLETNRPYLIPLKERLRLPADGAGKANPKSSTGRVDVFTRVITDESYRFDEIAAGYTGRLYLEVVPLSFPVRVREDLSLNQLRLSVGHAELTDDELCRVPPRAADPVLRCRAGSGRAACARERPVPRSRSARATRPGASATGHARTRRCST